MPNAIKIDSRTKKPLVLIAPLDWGLGHTTRCLPLIRLLRLLDYEVIFAGNRAQQHIIQSEFPDLPVVFLRGYNLRYDKNKISTILRIIRQIPAILTNVKAEKRWLDGFLKDHAVQLVISDNRYGLYSKRISSVFITHQLQIQTGLGQLLNFLVRKLNYLFINKFTECWVPDTARPPYLAGRLAHPSTLPATPVHYIGPLSRLQPVAPASATTYALLIILSGPEPQRTILERRLLQQLRGFTQKVMLVRGLPGETRPVADMPVECLNYADAATLENLLSRSSVVLTRSGYSSLMDLLPLGKKYIVVPTPGQAEQDYLARSLHHQKLVYSVQQDQLNLPEVMEQVECFSFVPYTSPAFSEQLISERLQELVKSRQVTGEASTRPGS